MICIPLEIFSNVILLLFYYFYFIFILFYLRSQLLPPPPHKKTNDCLLRSCVFQNNMFTVILTHLAFLFLFAIYNCFFNKQHHSCIYQVILAHIVIFYRFLSYKTYLSIFNKRITKREIYGFNNVVFVSFF